MFRVKSKDVELLMSNRIELFAELPCNNTKKTLNRMKGITLTVYFCKDRRAYLLSLHICEKSFEDIGGSRYISNKIIPRNGLLYLLEESVKRQSRKKLEYHFDQVEKDKFPYIHQLCLKNMLDIDPCKLEWLQPNELFPKQIAA